MKNLLVFLKALKTLFRGDIYHVYKARQIAKPKVNEAEKYTFSIGQHNKNGERMNN